MNKKDLIAKVIKFIPKKYILFITAQGTSVSRSSDVDIYCVANDKVKSRVHIFKDGNKRIEVFIDSWKDMVQKIKNFDEIAVGFITRMKLITGSSYHENAKSLIKDKFYLPPKRLLLLQYRIVVIGSKYISAKDHIGRSFFKGQVIPYLMLALFEKNGIWPHSPKHWIEQLIAMNDADAKTILNAIHTNTDLTQLIKKYTISFRGIHLKKESKDNKITYLG